MLADIELSPIQILFFLGVIVSLLGCMVIAAEKKPQQRRSKVLLYYAVQLQKNGWTEQAYLFKKLAVRDFESVAKALDEAYDTISEQALNQEGIY